MYAIVEQDSIFAYSCGAVTERRVLDLLPLPHPYSWNYGND
jgi:hypothetical protein